MISDVRISHSDMYDIMQSFASHCFYYDSVGCSDVWEECLCGAQVRKTLGVGLQQGCGYNVEEGGGAERVYFAAPPPPPLL